MDSPVYKGHTDLTLSPPYKDKNRTFSRKDFIRFRGKPDNLHHELMTAMQHFK